MDCGGYESFNSVSGRVNTRTLTHSVCTVCTHNILGLKTYPHPHKQTHTHAQNACQKQYPRHSGEYSTQSSSHTLCNCLFFVLISHPSTYPHCTFYWEFFHVSCGGLWLVLLCGIGWVGQITLCFCNILFSCALWSIVSSRF